MNLLMVVQHGTTMLIEILMTGMLTAAKKDLLADRRLKRYSEHVLPQLGRIQLLP